MKDTQMKKNKQCLEKEVKVTSSKTGFSIIQQLSKVNVAFVMILIWLSLLTQAATINFGSNGCTLQDAIRSANNDNEVGNCAAGSGADNLIAPDVWTITLNSTLPTISSDVTIRTATNSGLLKLSGDNDHAIMRITGNATDVVLERVFITEGSASSVRGAGIHIEDAQVTLENSIISSNSSRARFGGAIYIEDGELEVVNSYLELNGIFNNGNSRSEGGAIYASDSQVTIEESRFFYNLSQSRFDNDSLQYLDDGYGASIFMDGGELTVIQTLFDELTSAVHGEGTVAHIENSTFNRRQVLNWEDNKGHVYFTDFSALTLNHVTMKSAMRIEDSILNMTNSILRGNCNISDVNWLIDAGNLYNTPVGICPDTINLFYYPRLLDLDDNGGFSETFALDYNSEAINAGDPNYCLPTDQRGETRDTLCDIGSYEQVDFADIQVTGEIEQTAPYVHAQSIVYLASIKNNSSSLVNEVVIDVDTDHAVITDIDFVACPSFPCTLRGIQGFQEIVIPITLSLAPFDDDFEIEITAARSVNSTYTDTDASNDTDVLNESIVEGADLAVELTLLNPGNHFIGQTIKYEVIIDSLGFDPTNDVAFEFIPTGLSLLSMDGCNSVSGLICQLGLMNNGSSKAVTVNAELTATVFDAVGVVSSSVHDINFNNNTDLLGNNGALGETDIAINVTPITPAPYYSYGYIQVEVSISTGSQSASNLRLWADYPEAEFISCGVFINDDGLCEIPFIAANSIFNVTLEYFNPITSGSGQLLFPLHVFVATGEVDLDLSNNEQMIQIPVDANSDLGTQLTLEAQPPFYSGQELEFDLRIANGGVNHAPMVDIQLVPDNLSLIWVSGDLCQTVPCDISQLDRFNEENMTLVYRIIDEGEFSLTATVQSDLVDLVPNNNFDVEMGEAELAENDVIFADSFELD